jgi:FtsP/CotA-like multicopper oxidase with cupredoxin domain
MRCPIRPIDRRQLLRGMVTGAALSRRAIAAGAAEHDVMVLRAVAGSTRLLDDPEILTPVWGFNGQVPGPVLRARQGEPFKVRLANQLDQPLAIHWHGVRLANAMDGTSLTQSPVAPGGVFDYVFSPPDAGTYWYHPLINASGLRERGLSGLLLVEERHRDPGQADVPFVIDDWLLDREGLVDAASFGDVLLAGGEGRLGNWFTVNGAFRPTLEAPADRELRLRILNAANARIIELFIKGSEGWIIARDGQPSEPARLADAPVRLAPGQRADLLLPAGLEEPVFGLRTAGEIAEIAALRRIGRTAKRESNGVVPLPVNPLPDYFNYSATLSPTLTIEGGEGGGLLEAQHGGIMRSARDLVARGLVWSYSGQAGLGVEPLFRVARGVTVIMTVDNISRHTHVIHIHGHAARVVARSGRPAADSAWGDTFICPPIEPVKIIFIADNPGRWLISSTIAEHFDAGAQTWFEVAA